MELPITNMSQLALEAPDYTGNKEEGAGEIDNECLSANLPEELVGYILSRSSVEDVIRCTCVCKDWKSYIGSKAFNILWRESWQLQGPPWLFALSKDNCRNNCCAYNPVTDIWISTPLHFLPTSLCIPVAEIQGLLLVQGTNLQDVALCNPITKKWRSLSPLPRPQRMHVVAVIETGINSEDLCNNCKGFQIITAGGRSQDGHGYEPTIELYDSCTNSWDVVREVPPQYAARLAGWTLLDTRYCNGFVYCLLRSPGTHTIIAYDFVNRVWSDVMLPIPQLLSPFFVHKRGRPTLFGGVGSRRHCKCFNVWELHNKKWVEIVSTSEFRGRVSSKACDIFAGSGDLLYFSKSDLSRMSVCDLSYGNHEAAWKWVAGCYFIPIYIRRRCTHGIFLQPRLDV